MWGKEMNIDIKRIICVFLSMAVVLATPVYASEEIVSANVSYYCDDYFYIQIPSSIVVGDECPVTAVDINISPTKTVYVDLIGDPNTYITIYNENNLSESLDVYFLNNDGNNLEPTNMNLVSFGYGDNGISKSFSTYVSDTTGKQAGHYTGTAMFSIRCE